MYPYLTPHGLILKLNRQPLKTLPAAALEKAHEYWRKQAGQLLGNWIAPGIALKSVCDFISRVYRDGDLEGFHGDPDYVGADRSFSPRYLFGKLRQAQATLYEWHWNRAGTPEEKERMRVETELAYVQTVALCPDSSEYVRRFANWLVELGRVQDARLMAQSGLDINPGSKRLGALVEELQSK